MEVMSVFFLGNGHTLQNQHQRSPCGTDIDRLVGRIKHQYWGVQGQRRRISVDGMRRNRSGNHRRTLASRNRRVSMLASVSRHNPGLSRAWQTMRSRLLPSLGPLHLLHLVTKRGLRDDEGLWPPLQPKPFRLLPSAERERIHSA